MARNLCCWLIMPAAFLLDRVTKSWAARVLPGAPRQIVPGVIGLAYVENTGAAFGILRQSPGLLTGLAMAALAGLCAFLLVRGRKLQRPVLASLALLIGGALGNLYDRLRFGYVIDFIEVELIRFPVFNVADICLCVACGLLMCWILLGKGGAQDGG